MADPFHVVRGKAIGIAIGLGALTLAALVFVVITFTGYRGRQGRVDWGPIPDVRVAHPTGGSRLVAGNRIFIESMATGSAPIQVTELWINGSRVGEDTGPKGGVVPLMSSFVWVPASSGSYSLLARTRDSMGRSAVSDVVVVLVDPDPGAPPSSETGLGAVFPTAGPAPAPSGPTEDERTVAATPWSGTLGSWLNSLFVDDPPRPPGLNAQRNGCDAELRIRDLSENEEGFLLYRNSGGAWQEVGALAANSNAQWMTFTDRDLSGSVMYYVAAFNSQGKEASNLAGVHFPSADCAARPRPARPTGQLLRFAGFQPRSDVASAYCYLSFDGASWSRLPSVGFFDRKAAITQRGEAAYVMGGLGAAAQRSPKKLWLECWGWAGDTLVSLGDTVIDGIDLGQTGTMPFRGDGFSGQIHIAPPGPPPGPGMPGFTPTSAQMPYIDDWVDYRRDECETHIQPAGAWRCAPHATFNEGPTGPNPQPYILWDYREDVCPAGQYDDCLPISYWMDYANSLDMSVRVQVEEWFEEVELLSFSWSGNESESPPMGYNVPFRYNFDPSVPMYKVLPWNCTGDRHYRVRLAIVAPGWDPFYEPDIAGPWSNGVYGVLCRAPLGDHVFLEATFHSLTLANIEDCDPTCESTAEVSHGYFHVMPGGPQGTRPIGHLLMGWCEPGEYSVFAVESYHCLPVTQYPMGNGGHLLAGYQMCRETISTPGFECGSPPTNYVTNNNKIVFQVQNGEAVQLQASVVEWDHWSGDDSVCWSRVWTPNRTLKEWASIGAEDLVLTQSFAENGNADCSVAVTLRALSGPP